MLSNALRGCWSAGRLIRNRRPAAAHVTAQHAAGHEEEAAKPTKAYAQLMAAAPACGPGSGED
jgi:hypothetical protein